jgi:hypothetical protein
MVTVSQLPGLWLPLRPSSRVRCDRRRRGLALSATAANRFHGPRGSGVWDRPGWKWWISGGFGGPVQLTGRLGSRRELP